MLQFTNDTLFMCDAKIQTILVSKNILRCFEHVSGLKVNFHKNKIGGLNVEEHIFKKFSKIPNCNLMRIPFIYLGIPIEENPRKLNF